MHGIQGNKAGRGLAQREVPWAGLQGRSCVNRVGLEADSVDSGVGRVWGGRYHRQRPGGGK